MWLQEGFWLILSTVTVGFLSDWFLGILLAIRYPVSLPHQLRKKSYYCLIGTTYGIWCYSTFARNKGVWWASLSKCRTLLTGTCSLLPAELSKFEAHLRQPIRNEVHANSNIFLKGMFGLRVLGLCQFQENRAVILILEKKNGRNYPIQENSVCRSVIYFIEKKMSVNTQWP